MKIDLKPLRLQLSDLLSDLREIPAEGSTTDQIEALENILEHVQRLPQEVQTTLEVMFTEDGDHRPDAEPLIQAGAMVKVVATGVVGTVKRIVNEDMEVTVVVKNTDGKLATFSPGALVGI